MNEEKRENPEEQENMRRNPRTAADIERRRKKRERRRRVYRIRLAILIAILVVILAVIIFVISSIAKLIGNSRSSDSGNATTIESVTVSASAGENAATTSTTDEATSNGSLTDASTTTASTSDVLAAEELTSDDLTTDYVGELPDIDINSWEFLLVNADNPIGEYEPEITEYGRIEVDTRIVDALKAFEEAVEAQGLPIYLSSGYRSYDTQTMLFKNKINQGYSEAEAATIVAPPGTSEHQTGLAADITDKYRKIKNEELENTETYKWMCAHCQEYGFVVRFPKEKKDITGIIYEPWHFRYVGVEAATFMMNNNLCLEEFVELYK